MTTGPGPHEGGRRRRRGGGWLWPLLALILLVLAILLLVRACGDDDGDAVAFAGIVEKNLEAETYGLEGGDARLFREQGAHLRVQAGEVEKA